MKIDIDKTKQKENMKELTILESNEVEDKQEESPIYDYLKEHPSIFISIISGFVVVIGFLFNCIIYTDECKYLEYWNLNKELININNEHQIYELVMTSLFFFGLVFIQLFILNSVDRYYKDQKVFWKAKILGRKINRKYKKAKKEIGKIKRKSKRNVNNNFINEEIRNEEIYVEELETYLERYNSGVSRIKKILRKITMSYNIITIIFTLLFIFGSVYIFVTMCSINAKISQILISAVGIFCVLWLLACFGVGLGYIPEIYAEFTKLNMDEQVEKHIKSFEELSKMEKYPIQKLFEFDLKNLFRKYMLRCIIFYFIFLLFLFVGWISTSKTNQIAQNTKFDIIEYENTDYAIIYRDDKFFYLEEVKIEENDIYIYVNNQLRISSDELYSTNREFDNVIKVSREEIK